MSTLRGTLLQNVPLADFTSWRVGGPAQRLYQPADLEDLIQFLTTVPAHDPLVWLGLGSNTLVRDGGIAGTVIVTQGHLQNMAVFNGTMVRAQAGTACPALARFCARQSLAGIEFLAGIPGTVGGALALNAGCHGGETWNHVAAVETIDRNGNVHLRYPKEFKAQYRKVSFVDTALPQEWFIAAHFQLKQGAKEKSLETIRELLAYRTATQPTNEPSCGSVFRNPPGDYAARLIEASGLKGKTIGGASVSTKHANFIVNHGTATATDIEQLIDHVAYEVAARHGVYLVREVHVIGK